MASTATFMSALFCLNYISAIVGPTLWAYVMG
jgi:hypothetical protein